MKRFLLLITCFALLTGCATTQMIKPEQPPTLAASQDAALLMIVRDAWLGSGVVFWNYLDGKFIGETMGSTYFVTQVPPGKHYVVCDTENTAVAELDFKAGKRYFLRQGVTLGLWRARTSGFSPMTAAETQKVINNLTYLALDSTKTFPEMDPVKYKTAIDEYQAGIKEHPEGYKDMLAYDGE